MKNLGYSFCIVIIGLYLSTISLAEVKLPDVLASSMVLQQGQKVPIWGTADAGETVVVSFQKQKLTAIADANGKWRVDLKPLKATFDAQMLTIAGKNKVEFRDILIGEVWLVSGQSNMQRLLRETTDGEKVQAAANHPNIRLFNISRDVGFKKKQGKLAEWFACSPESVKDFSAAGYYFGVDLQKNLNVPIGLINSSYGGSQAEAWTPVEYLTANLDLKATVERTKIWDEERPRVKVEYADAIAKMEG